MIGHAQIITKFKEQLYVIAATASFPRNQSFRRQKTERYDGLPSEEKHVFDYYSVISSYAKYLENQTDLHLDNAPRSK